MNVLYYTLLPFVIGFVIGFFLPRTTRCFLIGHKWITPDDYPNRYIWCPRCCHHWDEETGEPRSLWEWIAWKWYLWRHRKDEIPF